MKPVLAVLILTALALPVLMPASGAQAQGAATGARRGAAEGDRVGGPVGAALGGAVGGMVGVLGEDPGPRGYRTGLPTRAGYRPVTKRHPARHHGRRPLRKR